MKKTKNCIRCLAKKAVLWSGHVLNKKQKIIAGWCKSCASELGFSGHYKEKMGKQKFHT